MTGLLLDSALAETGTTNIINGVSTNAGASFIIGDTGPFNALIITNAGSVISGNATVGNAAAANSNSVLVTGAGSAWSNSTGDDITVGRTGSFNQVTVSAGGLVTDRNLVIGRSASSSGNIVMVTGTGSVWSNSQTVIIGGAIVGSGGWGNQLIISNGGKMYSHASGSAGTDAVIGYNATSSNNSVLVTGVGSFWTNTTSLKVGDAGAGNQLTVADNGKVYNTSLTVGSLAGNNQLTVTGGGQVYNNGPTVIGNGISSSNNTVLVTGGSLFDNSTGQDIIVGRTGSYNQVTISGGSQVTDRNFILGGTPSSGGNIVTITGSGSSWTNIGNVSIGGAIVGAGGWGNQLIISDGAQFYSQFSPSAGYGAMIGGGGVDSTSSSSNNSVLVTGPGSTWNNTTKLTVGLTGAGNLLTVTNGGRVFDVDGVVGNAASSSNNVVTVTGVNSVWSNTGNLTIGLTGAFNQVTVASSGRLFSITNTLGSSGTGNQLTITNGGLVTSSFVIIGGEASSSNNIAVVSGAGSVWTNTTLGGTFVVGSVGAGNQLTVAGGGKVYNNGIASIGEFGASSNNTVLITGGSLFDNSTGQDIILGRAGSYNQVTVAGGSLVRDRNFVMGSASSSAGNRLVIDASVWTNTQTVIVGGAIVGTGGWGNQLIITNGGKMYSHTSSSAGTDAVIGYNATSSNNSVLVTGVGSFWTNTTSLKVGDAGAGNQLTVADGAKAYNTSLTVGSLAGNNQVTVTGGGQLYNSGPTIIGNGVASSSNIMLVTGGSLYANTTGDDINVGKAGSYNQVTVSGGSLVTDRNLIIGGATSSGSNTVIVTGAGSVWTNAGNVTIGGAIVVAGGWGNRLIISDGAKFYSQFSPSAGYGAIIGGGGLGSTSSSSNNSVLVTGSGSTWNNTTDLTVGSTGAGNRLTVANSGQVFSVSVTAGSAAGNNQVLVTNAGLLEANTLVAGAAAGNSISNVGGVYQFTVPAPTITPNGAGRIAITGGTVSFRAVTTAPTTPLVGLSYAGNNTLRLNNATNTGVPSYSFDSVANTSNPSNYQRLALANGGRWQSTTLTIGSEGALIGNGTVASDNVTNLGTIAPGFSAGSLTFTSNLVLGGSSILQMEIGGATLADYDQLIVSGSVTLTGTLAVASINGFNTTPGQTFTLIDNQGANLVVGEFIGLTNNSFIDATANGGNAYFFIQYNIGAGLNDVVLTATVPEPSALMLLAMGAFAALVRRRRR